MVKSHTTHTLSLSLSHSLTQTHIGIYARKHISLYTQTQPQVEKNGGEEEEEGRRVACLFVVQPNEQNVFDQRHLEFELWYIYV